jgi:hypothetical protein
VRFGDEMLGGLGVKIRNNIILCCPGFWKEMYESLFPRMRIKQISKLDDK